MIEYENISLKPFNTFATDAIAKSMYIIESEVDLFTLHNQGFFEDSEFITLGGGSNIVFVDDVISKPILKIQIKGLMSEFGKNSTLLTIGAGESWHEFIEYCIKKNLFGLENLALIPGTVGAAPIQNIGAYGVEQEKCFKSLRAFDIKSGQIITFDKSACNFAYRDSYFKRHNGRYIITSVTYELSRKFVPIINYKDLNDYFSNRDLDDIQPEEVFNAICDIRKSKIPYPDEIPNAGSFFKNPEIGIDEFNNLLKLHPEIGGFTLGNKVKIHAGKLIDLAGFKGYRLSNGEAGVSDKHALILVNYGNAKGADIFELSELIISKINEMFGIKLEREVNLV